MRDRLQKYYRRDDCTCVRNVSRSSQSGSGGYGPFYGGYGYYDYPYTYGYAPWAYGNYYPKGYWHPPGGYYYPRAYRRQYNRPFYRGYW